MRLIFGGKTVGDMENTVARRLCLVSLVLPFALVTAILSTGHGLIGVLRDQVRLYQAFLEGWRCR
jgi:hypothetical protein